MPPRDNRTEILNGLIRDNALLSATDIVKEQLRQAYAETTVRGMRQIMDGIISVCREIGNEYFKRFARLIKNHPGGIVACAAHKVTSGKCGGTVSLIRTVRRAAYGFKDTDYFFLRLMDASRGYPA